MKKALYFLVPLILALALRLYPTVISGMPFSTDAWSPIQNAELLLQYTPIPLNSPIFDGYNNYWPVNSIFGALISDVTSFPPITIMPLVFPLLGALTVLIFWVLVNRFYGAKIAFVGSLLFGTVFTHTYFTAGITKETYANPLYLLLILIFIHPHISKPKQIFMFTTIFVALTLTHHLTALIAILILTSIALAKFVNNTKKGLPMNKLDFLLIPFSAAIASLYYGLYATTGMSMPFTTSEWLSLASFQLLAFAAAMYLVYRFPVLKNARIYLITSAAVALAALLIFVNLSVTLVPSFTPAVQSQLLFFIFPNFLILPFVALGFEHQRRLEKVLMPLFWIVPLIGLEVYAVFSNSAQSLGLWIRTPNFLCIPVALLAAVGLYWLYESGQGSYLRKLAKPVAVIIVLLLVTLNVYSLYAAVSLKDRYMGYQWFYTEQEFKAGNWVVSTTNNQTIAGDLKVFYLMHDYFGVKVDSFEGLRYLASERSSQPSILVTYQEMTQNGYLLGVHGVDLPENWTQKASELNSVYCNGHTNVYAGAKTP